MALVFSVCTACVCLVYKRLAIVEFLCVCLYFFFFFFGAPICVFVFDWKHEILLIISS